MPTLLEQIEAARKENAELKAKPPPYPARLNRPNDFRSLGGKASIEKRRAEGKDDFLNGRSPFTAASGGHAGNGYPRVMAPNVAVNSSQFRSFAQKIRHKTKDGWELVDAVYEVFTRARAAQADGLILESATWLADRGFGKPVQVGQLLDGEGNPVAFTLWSPATNEPVGDVITLKDGKVVNEDTQEVYEPPATAMEEPKYPEPQPRDSFSYGVARPWGPGEPESKRGE